MHRDVEPQIGSFERPRLLERVDVLHHEGKARLVARREGQVVPPQRVLRQVADHRARLHPEQRRRQHLHHPAEHLGPERAGTGATGCPRLAGFELTRLGSRLPHHLPERRRERLEHRTKRVEMESGPTLGAERAERRHERGPQIRLGDDVCLRGARELVELLVRVGIDRTLGPTLDRDPRRDLPRHVPVDRPLRLQHGHELGEIEPAAPERHPRKAR